MTSEIGATPGLLGMWHINEGSGTVVNDSTGSVINGAASQRADVDNRDDVHECRLQRAHAQRDESIRDDGGVPGTPLARLHG